MSKTAMHQKAKQKAAVRAATSDPSHPKPSLGFLQPVDLIGDFGGRDLFFVDGDSLLSYFWLQPNAAKYDLPVTPSDEASLLYLVHLVEKFLASLRDCGAVFHVVFFEDHGLALSLNDPRRLAFREIVRQHLSLNTDIHLVSLSSWLTPLAIDAEDRTDEVEMMEETDWDHYLKDNSPLFALVFGPVVQEKKKPLLSAEKAYSILMEGFMDECHSRDMSIAFLPDISFEGSRVVANAEYCRHSYRNRQLLSVVRALVAGEELKKARLSLLSYFRNNSLTSLAEQEQVQALRGRLRGYSEVINNQQALQNSVTSRLLITLYLLEGKECQPDNSQTSPSAAQALTELVLQVLLAQQLMLHAIPLRWRSRMMTPVAIHREVRNTVRGLLMELYGVTYGLLTSEDGIRALFLPWLGEAAGSQREKTHPPCQVEDNSACGSYSALSHGGESSRDIFDLVDESLLLELVQLVVNEELRWEDLHPAIQQVHGQLWGLVLAYAGKQRSGTWPELVCSVAHCKSPLLASSTLKATSSSEDGYEEHSIAMKTIVVGGARTSSPPPKLLVGPLQNAFFNQFLSSSSTSNSPVDEKFTGHHLLPGWDDGNMLAEVTLLGKSEGVTHRDTMHWHSYKELETDDASKKQKTFWELKNEQTFARHLERYAQSLSSGKGSFMRRETVAGDTAWPPATRVANPCSSSSEVIKKESKGKKKKTESKREEILHKARREEIGRRVKKAFEQLLQAHEGLVSQGSQGVPMALGIIEAQRKVNDAFDDAEAPEVVAIRLQLLWLELRITVQRYIEARLRLRDTAETILTEEASTGMKEDSLHLGAHVFMLVDCLLAEGVHSSLELSSDRREEMELVFELLGFSIYLPSRSSDDCLTLGLRSQSPELLAKRSRCLRKSYRANRNYFDLERPYHLPPLRGFSALKEAETWRVCSLEMHPTAFQMLHMGPLLSRQRLVGSKKDHRVPFRPDEWQVKLLDAVDKGVSVLVDAPTSSGKTFIAYYAMEKVLRDVEDPEGVVVYVAPTKALVNQVAAEVYNKFKSAVPKTSESERNSSALVGIWTREYRYHPLDCRVLVTVPQMLEILLLSGTCLAHLKFTHSIRRIIFDEIQSMGSLEGGVVWERLILMCPVPIVCLSATLGDPDSFCSWLGGLKRQNKRQYYGLARKRLKEEDKETDELQYIPCRHRHADLAKFVYSGSQLAGPHDDKSLKGKGLWQGATLRPIHPWGCLTIATMRASSTALGGLSSVSALGTAAPFKYRVPTTVTLSSAECYEAFQAINAVLQQQSATARQSGQPDTLQDLERRLQIPEEETIDIGQALGDRILDRLDIHMYERRLRFFLERLLDAGNRDLFHGIVSRLREGRDKWERKEEEGICKPSEVYDLLMTLKEKDMLPAICFNFDRLQCRNLLSYMTARLAKEEKKIRLSAQWADKVARWEAYQAAKRRYLKKQRETATLAGGEKRKATRLKSPNGKRDAGKATLNDAEPFSVDPEMECFHPNDPDMRFTFTPRQSAIHMQELNELCEPFMTQLDKPTAFLLHNALRRGIGIHHAGMPRKYLAAVEVLMRKRHLQVVFATGTLALGINMPCRTAVMTGDSIFLTPGQYHQTSGRAGRRGFDLKGNVIFIGVPPAKIDRLVCSELPEIRGSFPFSVTHVLRLFNLRAYNYLPHMPGSVRRLGAHSVMKPDALITNLLWKSLYRSGKNKDSDTLGFFLDSAVDILRNLSVLNVEGVPINLAGLVMHLHYKEPGNLAFCELFRLGLFHDMTRGFCEATRRNPDRRMTCLRDLLLVLCHLFNRKLIPRHRVAPMKNLASHSSSSIILEDLPIEVVAGLGDVNSRIRQILTARCVRHMETIRSQTDLCHLPLSSVPFPFDVSSGESIFNCSGPPISSKIEELLRQSKVDYVAQCPFSAVNCPRGDSFRSLDDLARHVDSRASLVVSAISMVANDPADRTRVNAYIHDYFKHGQRRTIIEDNLIRESDAWQALRDFELGLKAIVVALRQFYGLASEIEDEQQFDGPYMSDNGHLGRGDEDLLAAFTALGEEFSKKFATFGTSWK